MLDRYNDNPSLRVSHNKAPQGGYCLARRLRVWYRLTYGGGTRVNTLGAPAVAKQTKPIIHESCLSAGPSGARGIYTLKKTRFGRPCGTLNAVGACFFYRTLMGRNTALGAGFLLGFRMCLILAQTDQVYLILAFFART